MTLYLDLPDIEPIKPQRKSYMFSIVTLSEPEEEYKEWTLDRLDIDKEQCFFVPLKNHKDKWDILLEEISLCNPRLVIFSHCDEIPKKIMRKIKQFVTIDDEISDETYAKIEKISLSDFPHLHLHDEYSLRDGLGTIQQRSELMMERHWTYLTATNHGSIGGWIKQYFLAKDLGMKPIFGIEAYMNKYRKMPKETYKDMNEDMKIKYRRNHHQILLAKNLEGFFNIIKIQNDAELNGFYYKPRTDPDFLMKYGKGIIATSTDGGAGEIPCILTDESIDWQERIEIAKERYDFYKEAFDDFYIELNLIEWDKQPEINRLLISFGEWVGAEYIITSDVHYLRKKDYQVHDILLMLRDNNTMVDKAMSIAAKYMKPLLEKEGFNVDPKSDEWKEENKSKKKLRIIKKALSFGRRFLEDNNYTACLDVYDENADKIKSGKSEVEKSLNEDSVWEFEGKDFHLKTLDDFYKSWKRMHGQNDEIFTEDIFWKAVKGTRKLARSIENFELDTSIKLPKMSDDSNKELELLARKGMDKLNLTGKKEYEERLQHELSVINGLDFADYFLIFNKIVDYCKENNILTGPGRGCFRSDSKVFMANNKSKTINQIKKGDKVISDNGSVQVVEETFEYEVDEKLLEIKIYDGRSFYCTKDHGIFVYTKENKYIEVKASELIVGNKLVDVFQSENKDKTSIVSIKEINYKGKVYDLTISERHTYNIEGIAVHNSAAGCLISYCLEITKVDPIKYNLLFERFLDASRSDPPDIDWDVDPRYRKKVKDAMGELFGENYVCSIGSYQLIKTKTAIKDVGRVFCLDASFLNEITKGLSLKYKRDDDPTDEEGDVLDKLSWDELIEMEPSIKNLVEEHPYISDSCNLLRGQIRNIGKHPAGMIVASVDLTEWIPLRTIKSKNEFGEQEDEIVACWTEGLAIKELQEIGLVKYDILGLTTISILSEALRNIENTTRVITLENNKKIRLKEDDDIEILASNKKDKIKIKVKELKPNQIIIGVPEEVIGF